MNERVFCSVSGPAVVAGGFLTGIVVAQEELTILSDEYESTLIELEETQSELSKTTDALLQVRFCQNDRRWLCLCSALTRNCTEFQAREHIEERDHLIEAHLNSESVLATHAENLTDELSRTAGDLLHAIDPQNV